MAKKTGPELRHASIHRNRLPGKIFSQKEGERLVCLKLFFEIVHRTFEGIVGIDQIMNALNRMDHGAVVAAAELLSNLFQGIVRVFFCKIHRYLACGGDFFLAGFVFEVVDAH